MTPAAKVVTAGAAVLLGLYWTQRAWQNRRIGKIVTAIEQLQEQAVIEFATAHEVVFGSNLPLEFEDALRLINSDGSLDVQATVVAVRYQAGRKAVAARFVTDVKNWIVKP